MHQVKVEKFEGPLDLLLQLIENQELDITQVSLAEVTEQYLKHLDQIEETNPEELADFLVIAAKLLFIKSKTLLPMLDFAEEEEELHDLENQLKIYKEYLNVSQVVQKIIAQQKFTFSRLKPLINDEIFFREPQGLTKENMYQEFLKIVEEVKLRQKLPEKLVKRMINIQEKIRYISEMIRSKVIINFNKLCARAKDKTEVIVSFLAILELVKQKVADVDQKRRFCDIEIRKID